MTSEDVFNAVATKNPAVAEANLKPNGKVMMSVESLKKIIDFAWEKGKDSNSMFEQLFGKR